MRQKNKRRKIPQKICYLAYSMYLCPDKEPLKQAGGSASSGLTIRISRQNTEIRRFPNCNLENRAISQTSDKQRWFEISSKVTKSREQYKIDRIYFYCRDGVTSSCKHKVTKINGNFPFLFKKNSRTAYMPT